VARILVLDNYDSFTWNLVHYLRELGAEVRVERNDAVTATEALADGSDGILVSPGPGTPDGAGISLELVGACAEAKRPLLGVCLGHHAIGQFFGGSVERAPRLMHGKTCDVDHDGSGVFAGLPSPFTATRYQSSASDPRSPVPSRKRRQRARPRAARQFPRSVWLSATQFRQALDTFARVSYTFP
jgi:anthranilate synthase component 2